MELSARNAKAAYISCKSLFFSLDVNMSHLLSPICRNVLLTDSQGHLFRYAVLNTLSWSTWYVNNKLVLLHLLIRQAAEKITYFLI
jgi:hypothetical protein